MIARLLFFIIITTALACIPVQDIDIGEPWSFPAREVKKPTAVIKSVPEPDTLCIAAVGDIMLGTSYPDNKTLPPDSARNSFKSALSELQTADVTFGNLEGTLLDAGDPVTYKFRFRTRGYLFRMPARYGTVLKDAGFKVVSLANNHIGDFGDTGLKSTTRTLDSLGINYGGLRNHPASVFKVNGIRYGFCAFAPGWESSSIFDLRNAAAIIRELKQQCDVVIVSFHGGNEGALFEHVPFKNELFNNSEPRGDVHAFAHNAIDAGADLIFGNGPHVSRAMELYKNRLIAYSLGNFCTYRSVSVSGVCGVAPLLKVYVNKKGEFLKGRIAAFKQTHNNGLQPDSLNTAVARIKSLTEADFPRSGLSIADDGGILPALNN